MKANQFDRMYGTYQKYVAAAVCRRVPASVAEDVAQNVWMMVFQKLSDDVPVENEKAWLENLVRAASAEYHRQWNPKQSLDAPAAQGDDGCHTTLGETIADLADPVVDPELSEKLRAGVDMLTPTLRETMEEYYFEGLTAEDIALRHTLKLSTVKMRLLRGRDAVRSLLHVDVEEQADQAA